MAHFAKIGMDNKVIGLVYLRNVDNIDPITGVEDEKFGLEHLKKNHGHECWVQYSSNTHHNIHSQGRTPFRGNAPRIGWTYNSTKDGLDYGLLLMCNVCEDGYEIIEKKKGE